MKDDELTLWRASLRAATLMDLKKAAQWINEEIARREEDAAHPAQAAFGFDKATS